MQVEQDFSRGLNDGGQRWYHVQDNALATPGYRPAAAYLIPDSGPGDETYSWPVPDAQFPAGGYQLRVDCFRVGSPIHFSYHRTKIFVSR